MNYNPFNCYNLFLTKKRHRFISFYFCFVLCAFSWFILLLFTVNFLTVYCKDGLRGEGGWRTPFFRYSTPCLPKGFPLYNVLRYPYLVTDPLAFGAKKKQNYTGERAQKKTFFWWNFSKKKPKKPFLACFFESLPLAKTVYFKCFGRARKINLVGLKEGPINFCKFLKNPPPKISYPPLVYWFLTSYWFLLCFHAE